MTVFIYILEHPIIVNSSKSWSWKHVWIDSNLFLHSEEDLNLFTFCVTVSFFCSFLFAENSIFFIKYIFISDFQWPTHTSQCLFQKNCCEICDRIWWLIWAFGISNKSVWWVSSDGISATWRNLYSPIDGGLPFSCISDTMRVRVNISFFLFFYR